MKEGKLIEDQIQKAREHRNNIDSEFRKIDNSFNTELQNKKTLEKELNDKRATIEAFINSEAEAAFNAYLAEQSSTFEVIARTYGGKVYKFIRNLYLSYC